MDIFSATISQNQEEMLRLAAEELYKKGFVKDTYLESLLSREKLHPTGLPVEDFINVAIPHTDVEHVLIPTMVVIKHGSSTFSFRRMDEPTEWIPVEVVFLLVVKEPDGYVNFLADLTSLFQEMSFIEMLQTLSADKIGQALAEKLNRFGLVYQGSLLSAQA
jgi:PTS system galactitol-specific IIA component